MHKFYFNECLPQRTVSFNDFISLLSNTIKEFDSLVKKNIEVDKGIFLEKESEKTIVCERNLKEAIASIPDSKRELRNLAFAFFTKYPIHHFLQSEEIEDKILTEGYLFDGIDATNLAIAKHHECFLFSVATDIKIRSNALVIKGNNTSFTLDNLYGEGSNTQYIEAQIANINKSALSLFGQLKAELKNPVYSSAFEKAFFTEQDEVKKSIIDAFKHAKIRGLITPYYPDTKIIKDVTPDNNRKDAKVYELRVYSPKALRVYFWENNGIVYLAKLEYKSSYKKEDSSSQSRDISRALTIIDNMIKTQ